ncbi:MAG: aspartyl protease family protein [Endomicrobiaceae bacterium]|nr:aspartyl protease family protein [Endomicrobiaceae bacterium]
MTIKFYIKNICYLMLLTVLILPVFASQQNITKIKSGQTVIIPLDLNGKMKGMPIVNIKINGQILHLALDTGADNVFIALTPEALNKTNVKTSENIKKNLDVNGQLYKSRTVKISAIEIGELLFNNVEVCEELRNTNDGSEGIIGNKFFDNFNVLIDYSQSRMILHSNTTLPSDLDLNQWLKIPFIHESIGIIIEGLLEKQKKTLRFCLDSGAVAVNEKEKPFDLLKLNSLILKNQVNDAKTYSDNIIINKKNIGLMDFYLLDFIQPDVDGFLGYGFLSKYKIFIDFPKQIIYIKSNNL